MGLLDVLNGMQNGPRGPSNAERARQRQRNVADDHGDPWTAGLQGVQTFHRQPAGRHAGPGACASPGEHSANAGSEPAAAVSAASPQADWAACSRAAPRAA